MKKLFVTLFCLAFIGSIQAQDFSIGPKVGVSQGNVRVDGNDFSTSGGRMGYHIGGFLRMGGNMFFIQPEVLYTNTGGEIEERTGTGTVSYEATFNRLDVPVMLGLRFAEVFRVQAGPVASFLLSSDWDGNPDVDFNSTTIGYQAGIGLDIANLIIDLKYEGPLGNTADRIAGFNTDLRQNQIILSLGFRIF
jgi:hypothetical protein